MADGLNTQIIKDAILNGGEMTIGGTAGRWNPAGDQWTAYDLADTDTIIIARISDADEQDVNGVARQVTDMCKMAVSRDLRVRAVLVENDTSAFKRRKIKLPNGDHQLRTVRPQFRKALSLLARGDLRYCLVYHLDRMVRDPRDLEDLIDVVEASKPRIVVDSWGGSLRLATDSDITSARIHCAIANQASRDTARRVSRARQQQAEEGRFGGGGTRRFGFEDDGRTVRPAEAKTIADCTDAALGDVAMKEIARDLRRAGITRPDGGQWTGEAARDMLLRPCNAGLTVHRKGVRGRKYYTKDDVVGSFTDDPIVEPEKYWALVGKLTDPDRRTNSQAGTVARWLGSCIWRCECGDALRVQNKKRKLKDRRTGETTPVEERIYRCHQNDSGHVTISMDELDALAKGLLFELIRTSDPADIIGTPTAEIDVAALRAEIKVHRVRLEEIAADYEDDIIDRAQMLTRTKKRRAKIEAAQAKIDEAAEEYNPAIKLVDAEDIEAAWMDLTLGEQREIVRRLLPITVLPIGRGRRVPARDRIRLERPLKSA
ncbi:recombinase family protein [Sinosporangium siamense]|uniref:Recombinase domain-containing protein n=1 Tax=Sinosporangium siamense TaxID=1367973 RepID=A0A919VCG1_9ACTN|nr:recombinase family protein [Sinosporangium siamense]GII97577.1 hypothetical protein Ssi02_78080 [Sinosporangium siamense]